MKKTQLKALLKPIVKECINEALIEQGLLSNIISEVVKGLGPAPIKAVKENEGLVLQQIEEKQQVIEERQKALKEQKRKLLDAAGFQQDIFEGVTPISSAGDPADSATAGQGGALAGIDPGDAGVDLTGIMSMANRDWKNMI